MKKIIKRVIIVLVVLLVIMKGMELWIENNFEARINSNPDRAYNITYSDLNLDTFFRGITLDDVSIEPINPIKKGTIIKGHVDYATLNGLALIDLLFSKSLNIDEIAFEQPKFEITLSTDTIQKSSGKGVQSMFGDIFSRMNINNFRIDNGSVVIIDPISKTIKGQVKQVNIRATQIDTDALKFDYLIPFEMDDLEITLEGMTFELNDYTHFELGRVQYKLRDKEVLINDISLSYSIDWVEVSERVGLQNDIIELDVKEVAIHQFEPSNNFYLKGDIEAQMVSLDEFNIKLQRNKNIPRPPDTKKPSFQGMINAIPVALRVDSVKIANSSVTYAELGVKKSESGSIKIQEINGAISGVTNIPDLQSKFGRIEANIEASLLGEATIKVKLDAPYDSDGFTMAVDVGAMDLTKLNPTLRPLAGLEFKSGQMRRIQFNMNAGLNRSQNSLVFDYENLHLNVLNQKSEKKGKKKGFLSALANSATRNDNLPNQKRYLTAQYQSNRNVYRSPVNYIIKGLFQGFTRIVPGRFAQKFIN